MVATANAPPTQFVRTLKALADERRLRILVIVRARPASSVWPTSFA